jgi:hypothetical protein
MAAKRRLFIPNPICVRPAPLMRSRAAGEILVCYQDQFTVRLARRGFAADVASAKARPRLKPIYVFGYAKGARNHV